MGKVKELYMDLAESFEDEAFIEGLEDHYARLEEQANADLFESLYPTKLPTTNCFGIASKLRGVLPLDEVFYVVDGLHVELTFEGQKYTVEIKPKKAA